MERDFKGVLINCPYIWVGTALAGPPLAHPPPGTSAIPTNRDRQHEPDPTQSLTPQPLTPQSFTPRSRPSGRRRGDRRRDGRRPGGHLAGRCPVHWANQNRHFAFAL